MQYRLRTLVVAAIVVPPLLAGTGWFIWSSRQPLMASFAIAVFLYVCWIYWQTYTKNRR